jgi:hypothetical protein
MSRANRTDEQQDTESDIVVLTCQNCVLEWLKMKWIRLKLNEFVHIKHNNSVQDKNNFNDSAGAVVMWSWKEQHYTTIRK